MGSGVGGQGPRSGREAGRGGTDLRSKLGGPLILEGRRAPMPNCHITQREDYPNGGAAPIGDADLPASPASGTGGGSMPPPVLSAIAYP